MPALYGSGLELSRAIVPKAMIILDPKSQEMRDAYDDYVSSCIEKGSKPVSYDAWVEYHWRAPVEIVPVDPDDDLPF